MNVPPEILTVAEKLDDLRPDVVFVGGMVRSLLVTDPTVPGVRPTRDVDIIVDSGSRVKHADLSARLRKLGFREDMTEGAPICRYLLRRASADGQDLPVDVMPLNASIFGFSNRWYPSAFATAKSLESAAGQLRVIDAPHYLATKLDSFQGRGDGDYYHHDLEDLVVLVDGRAELLEEMKDAPPALQRFCAEAIASLLADDGFLAALPGHLPPDPTSQARLPRLLQRLGALAATAE